jgi:hypothetical protein
MHQATSTPPPTYAHQAFVVTYPDLGWRVARVVFDKCRGWQRAKVSRSSRFLVDFGSTLSPAARRDYVQCVHRHGGRITERNDIHLPETFSAY